MSLEVHIEKKLSNMTLKVDFVNDPADGVLGILGASGCGKSMTLKCIAGIETPDQGRIVLNGRVLFDSEKKINMKVQDRRVGYLFQNYALFPGMTAFANVEMAIHYSNQHKGIKTTRKEEHEKAMYYMRLLHVEQLKDQYPRTMSGGQQQRVALARILASDPEVLMLDEPFSAVDAYLREQLQLELCDLFGSYGKDVLMVTHSRDEIYRFCDRMLVIEGGHQMGYGTTKELFADPETIAAARLTGCKNIVHVEILDDHHLLIPDWNAKIAVKGRIPEQTAAIGIRAHYMHPVSKEQLENYRNPKSGELENVVACSRPQILEDPFERVVVFEHHVWWKISKEIFEDVYKEKLPGYLSIPESSILYLHE